jgi:hypothetical protein
MIAPIAAARVLLVCFQAGIVLIETQILAAARRALPEKVCMDKKRESLTVSLEGTMLCGFLKCFHIWLIKANLERQFTCVNYRRSGLVRGHHSPTWVSS